MIDLRRQRLHIQPGDIAFHFDWNERSTASAFAIRLAGVASVRSRSKRSGHWSVDVVGKRAGLKANPQPRKIVDAKPFELVVLRSRPGGFDFITIAEAKKEQSGDDEHRWILDTRDNELLRLPLLYDLWVLEDPGLPLREDPIGREVRFTRERWKLVDDAFERVARARQLPKRSLNVTF